MNNAITANTSAIAAEKARAELAESNIANSVATEKTRAEAAEAALDAKIDAKTFEITSEDSSTLDLTVTDGSKISGNVLVANGGDNIIKAAADSSLGTGLYASVDLSYDAATNKLKLTTSALEKEIALSVGSILKSIEYDSVGKNLIIKYETVSAGQVIEQQLSVPVEDLFNDWTVQQGEHLGAIILHKTDGVSGNPDVLSAEIVLSTLEDNMLINDQGSLYVSRKPIDEVSAATVENRELIDNIIEGSGLASDGKFNFMTMSGHKYIASAQNITDTAVLLDNAVKDIADELEELKEGETTYSVRLYKNADSGHLAADVKIAQTNNKAQTDVTLSYEQYIAMTMKNLLKVVHVENSMAEADTNGIFFDGSIDYGAYDDFGNVIYDN